MDDRAITDLETSESQVSCEKLKTWILSVETVTLPYDKQQQQQQQKHTQ